MESVMRILNGFPWWVWALLAYIVLRGLKAAKERVVSVNTLFYLPILFIAFSLYSLHSRYALSPFPYLIWAASVALFSFGTVKLLTSLQIAVDKKKMLLHLPGTWSTLLLMLTVFLVKTSLGVLSAVHPEWKDSFAYQAVDLAFSGLVSGYSLGRALAFWGKFLAGAHSDLVESR